MTRLLRLPGARLVSHALLVVVVYIVMSFINDRVDPLTNTYIANIAMYATAMFGMVILVGLSGQVSLGNGALMAVGAYSFALTSLNWQTVPILGVPMNGFWAMVFALIGGIFFGLLIGFLGARLQGPYLAGLTLGVAAAVPAIANRFPDLLGGEEGLQLTVPYPEGGYALTDGGESGGEEVFPTAFPTSQEVFPSDLPTSQDDFLSDLPTSQEELPSDAATLNPDDVLSASDFPSDAATLSPDDVLTASDFPSEAAASGDVLTASDFPSDAATFPPASPGVDAGVTDVGGGDINDPLSASFVLEHWQASLAITVACLAGFVALNLVRGRQGTLWRAVRDDSIAAAVSGINPAKAKIAAFVVSSVFAALAGGVFAQILAYVGPGAFGLSLSLSLLVGIILGGRSSLVGALIGACLLIWLPEFVHGLAADRGWEDQITNNAPNLIYGLLVVLVVLVMPGGIVGGVRDLFVKVTRRQRSGD